MFAIPTIIRWLPAFSVSWKPDQSLRAAPALLPSVTQWCRNALLPVEGRGYVVESAKN
jgi:hypothetical protein